MSTKMQTRAKKKSEGICKLTGKTGKFANAHILPRALTRLSLSGEKIKETSLGARPRSRPQTWYDNALVIQEGEKILEEIDTPAIAALRRHKLVWSSFDSDVPFASHDLSQIEPGLFLREVDIGNAHELRLFFLSIVWRAAASSRPEFADVQVADDVLEDLRQRVLLQDAGSFEDYPIILDQLITRGHAQNRTPILEHVSIPADGMAPAAILTVRIYMDGLVAKVFLPKGTDMNWGASGKIILGAADSSFVYCRPFEESRTESDMREVIYDNARRGYG